MHPNVRLAAALTLGALSACDSSDDENISFQLRTTNLVALDALPPVVSGRFMIYFAAEVSQNPATDLNGDTDTDDGVAVLVDLRTSGEVVLDRAARTAAVLGDDVYLVVPEDQEQTDFNGDADEDDFALFYWDAADEMSRLVAPLRSRADASSAPELVVVEDRLYFSEDATGLAAGMSTLRYVTTAAPEDPVEVGAEGSGIFPLELMGEADGLLLVALDETVTPDNFNTDSDQVDAFVLGLCDATDVTAEVRNTGAALASATAPTAVLGRDDGTWTVAFLISEAAQNTEGNTNSLNSSDRFPVSWRPENCFDVMDEDADDDVLHFIEFDPAGVIERVNTGLAGTQRILLTDLHVATLAPESDAGCDFNADDDMDDRMLRWVALAAPELPPGQVADQIAVKDLPAPTSADVGVLSDRFVIVVSEMDDQRDRNGDGLFTFDLIAVLNPAVTTTWTFEHDTGSDMMSAPYAGASWMARESTSGRLPMVFQERVPDANLNTQACSSVKKDDDMIDGLPTWPRIETAGGPEYTVRGSTFAVQQDNPGIVVARSFALFRVSELEDNRDYNNDGDLKDKILFRNPLQTCEPVAMATASSRQGDVVYTDGDVGAAFLSSESDAQVDLNNDGIRQGSVVRYFVF